MVGRVRREKLVFFGKPPAMTPYRFKVTWDKQEHRFNTFTAARDYLAIEIWWLAEDSGDQKAFEAWKTVRNWEQPTIKQSWSRMKYQVKVGRPAAVYRIEPEFL